MDTKIINQTCRYNFHEDSYTYRQLTEVDGCLHFNARSVLYRWNTPGTDVSISLWLTGKAITEHRLCSTQVNGDGNE